MPAIFDRTKTLTQLERDDWGEPPKGSTGLVQECHRLRKVPLNQFTPENLRLMIGQQISLFYLVPLAIEVLEADPFTEGDLYPGDLLVLVTSVPESYWRRHTDVCERMQQIVRMAKWQLKARNPDESESVHKRISELPDVLRGEDR
ncbi:MAG: hypothetical protein KDA65_17305 [Planctomycetaceae bacterium]|nr:hypothetical protein [Planctomycetaceae bacterium]